jgi:hypothetical protein
MPRAITHCPQCGERVTPYAAGCAVCGADIETARNEVAARRGPSRVIGGPGMPRFRIDDDALRLIIALLVALAAPLFGLLLACWFAWHAHGENRPGMRNAMLAIAVLAALPMVTGIYVWGRFIGGL